MTTFITSISNFWFVALIFLILSACGTTQPNKIVALVNDDVILEKEIRAGIPYMAFEDKEQLVNLERKELTRLIAQKLLQEEAERQKLTITELLAKDVYRKMKPVTQKEIRERFEQNKGEFQKVTFEEAKKMIEDLLYRERKREAFSIYYNQLIEKGNVHVFLPSS